MRKCLVRSCVILAAYIVSSVTPVLAEGDLHIFNWAGYTPPEVVKAFEQETGIKVSIDTYDSNDALLAKLEAGGGGFDIIVTSHSFIPIHIGEKLIQRIKLKEMTNYKNLSKDFVNPSWDPEGDYTIPYQWGTTSFSVDTAVYDKPIDSLEFLFNPPDELRDKIGLFKTPSDLLGLAEIYLGIPFCSENPTEMKKVLDLLKTVKPKVKVFGSISSMREQMLSGELAMFTTYSGSSMRARDQKSTIKYIYPKEGVLQWADVIAVPTDAKNYKNARNFINFLLKPEISAKVSNFAKFANGVPASAKYLDKSLVNAPEFNVPEGTKLFPMVTCPEKGTELETRVMTQLLQ